MLNSNFQAGVDSIYDALVAKGATPASKALGDIVNAINNMGLKIKSLGSSNSQVTRTFYATSIPNYQKLTLDNFYVRINGLGNVEGTADGGNASMSYNPNTGVLTIGSAWACARLYAWSNAWVNYTVYCIYV